MIVKKKKREWASIRGNSWNKKAGTVGKEIN